MSGFDPSGYQLFIDLDGVLCDFDGGVRSIFGTDPAELAPRTMWPVIARTPGFYDRLAWTADGRQLWEAVRAFEPAILTGLPLGKWAEPQKRSWCRRELGPHVPVITGLSRHKAELALQWMAQSGREGRIPVLVDDRMKLKDSWEDSGGVFIFHVDAGRSIEGLKERGFPIA